MNSLNKLCNIFILFYKKSWIFIPKYYSNILICIFSLFYLVLLACYFINDFANNSENPAIHKIYLNNIEKKIKTNILTVEINGNIKNPGIYYLPKGSTLKELIKKAGGLNIHQKDINYKTKYRLKDYKLYYIK